MVLAGKKGDSQKEHQHRTNNPVLRQGKYQYLTVSENLP